MSISSGEAPSRTRSRSACQASSESSWKSGSTFTTSPPKAATTPIPRTTGTQASPWRKTKPALTPLR